MATKKQNSDQSETPQNAYFLSLELENVKCFGEKQKIDFSDGEGQPKQWTIILGDNGTGKTTILQSLVAMLPTINVVGNDISQIPICYGSLSKLKNDGSIVLKDWLPFRNKVKDINQNNPYYAYLRAEFLPQNGLDNKIGLAKFNNKFSYAVASVNMLISYNCWDSTLLSSTNILIKVNCFSYGASRKSGETSLSNQNEEPGYKTLFDDTALLLNPEEWFIRADYYASKGQANSKKKREKQLKIVIEMLKGALPDIEDIKLSEKEIPEKRLTQPIVEFKTPYGWVEAKDLSLGYRTSMAWMVDFASRMFDLYPDSKNPLAEPAVVLIDEIDLHLHPKWQRDLLDWLSDLCPNTQFIVTTHSPLIVQSAAARDANFAVCRREGDHVVIDQSLEAVKGWRADQILTSDLFGLESARDIELEKLEKEQRKILSKAKLTKSEEKRAKEIAQQLSSLRVMENPEDDKAMEIIRRAAKSLENNGSK